MAQERKILGHIVSKNGISIDKEKIKMMLQLPQAINLKQVQGFMHHCGYYQGLSFDFPTLLLWVIVGTIEGLSFDLPTLLNHCML